MGPLTVHARGLTLLYGPRRRRAQGPPWRRRARDAGGRAPAGEAAGARAGGSAANTAGERKDGGAPGSDAPRGVAGLDLDCGPGEIVGLLGPNGAGKSTVLRMLATLAAPDAGELRLLGQAAFPPAPALRRRIGYAADEPVHLEPLSGRYNATFFARAAGLPAAAAEAAAAGLLDRFGLDPDADAAAAAYSYGMRRKLLLVQALVHSPALLVLDEPTLGLDPDARDALRQTLAERARAGATVVLATQDVDEARRVCHRVVFLHRGRAVLDGSPEALLRRVGAGTLVDVATDGAPPTAIEWPGDHVVAEVVTAGDGRLTLRCPAGAAALPAICDALVRAGTRIRAIHVREPDLRDVFAAVTGAGDHGWTPPGDPTDDPNP